MAKILLIDDEPGLLAMLAEGLALDGHQVTAVSSGRSLLASVETGGTAGMYDLVITDLTMPEMNGLDLIRAFKAANPPLPIITMSGGARAGAEANWREAADALGVADALAKPFTISDLRATVAHVLQGAVLAR